MEILLNVLSADDSLTERHSRRVAELTDALADGLGLGVERRATLRVAALLHDMGKIDDSFFDILHSREKLSEAERSEIRRHPYESAHILEPLEPFHPGITSIVSSHHECWNGEGYPNRLEGEEIPLGARVIAVADVFDALSQARAYRNPISFEEGLETIHRGSGTQFDPRIVGLLDRPEIRGRWREIHRIGMEEERRAAEHERAISESSPQR